MGGCDAMELFFFKKLRTYIQLYIGFINQMTYHFDFQLIRFLNLILKNLFLSLIHFTYSVLKVFSFLFFNKNARIKTRETSMDVTPHYDIIIKGTLLII